MTTFRPLICVFFGILIASPLSAQKLKAYGWWKILAAKDHPKILYAENCYVFISAETVAIFRPSAQIVGDFATATVDVDAWSHDVKALTQNNEEIFAILDHGMRAHLVLDAKYA